MAESGSPPTELAKKLDEIISEMEDGEKKTKAAALSKNCRCGYWFNDDGGFFPGCTYHLMTSLRKFIS